MDCVFCSMRGTLCRHAWECACVVWVSVYTCPCARVYVLQIGN